MSDAAEHDGADGPTRRRNAVNRVLAELRRGLPVLLQDDGGAAVALAAETATRDQLARLLDWGSGEALIAVTGSRARALNVRPSGHDVVLIPWRSWFDLATVRGLGDATTDLAEPLRGPFDRVNR